MGHTDLWFKCITPFQQPLNLADSYAPIVARLVTILRIAIFVTHLHTTNGSVTSCQTNHQKGPQNPSMQGLKQPLMHQNTL